MVLWNSHVSLSLSLVNLRIHARFVLILFLSKLCIVSFVFRKRQWFHIVQKQKITQFVCLTNFSYGKDKCNSSNFLLKLRNR